MRLLLKIGFLLRGREQFFQALHGPREVVLALMQRIHHDTRHREVEVLLSEDTDEPTPFRDWAMGYNYVAEDELGLALSAEGIRPEVSPAKARELWLEMVEQAQSESEWGGGSPYSRKPAESVDAWIQRLSAARSH